jgi:hypothetical protein
MMILFKTLLSGWCNKVTLLSLCLYCIVFWYITLVMSTYVWKIDPGTHMLCIRFCPQNWVWHLVAPTLTVASSILSSLLSTSLSAIVRHSLFPLCWPCACRSTMYHPPLLHLDPHDVLPMVTLYAARVLCLVDHFVLFLTSSLLVSVMFSFVHTTLIDPH